MKQRIITAIIAIAVFLPFVLLGGSPFTILIYTLATIGLYELLRMRGLSLFSFAGLLTTVILWIILIPEQYEIEWLIGNGLDKLQLIFIFIVVLLAYTVIKKNVYTFDHIGFLVVGAFYVGIGFYYFIETRSAGLEFVLFALAVIWSTDSGAYFVGRKIGKRKLWPEISPNKTIEGFYGGIVCAVIFASVLNFFLPVTTSWLTLLVVTIIASIGGQLGDLVESAIKRHYNVKDSGTILPGHGGILDRFDSLLFVLPILHFLQFIG